MYPRNAASPERILVGAVVQISDGVVQTSGVSITVRGQGGAEAAGGGTTAYGASGVVYYTPTQAETNFTSFVVSASKTGCIPIGVTVVTTASDVPGYAGLAWDKINAPTTAQNLSGTNIDVDQVVASVSGAVGSVTGAVGSVTGAVGSVTGAVGSVTGNVGGNVVGSVGSVTGNVGGNVNGNVVGSVGSISGVTFPTNFGVLVISGAGKVTVGTNDDKTGYAVGAGGIDAAAFAAGAITASAIAANAIGASELASDAAEKISDALLARNIAGGSNAGRIVKEALYSLRNRVEISGGILTVYLVDDATPSWTAAVSVAPGDPLTEIDPT